MELMGSPDVARRVWPASRGSDNVDGPVGVVQPRPLCFMRCFQRPSRPVPLAVWQPVRRPPTAYPYRTA
jgi:hypothetical protein